MVWGLVLEPGKKYAQDVKTAVKITHASLDLDANCGDRTTIYVGVDDLEFIVCHLTKRNPDQKVNLVLDTGDKISLFTKGSSTVHLIGYEVPEDMMDVGSDDDEDEEVPVLQAIDQVPKKSKEKVPNKVQEKKQQQKRKTEDYTTPQSKKMKSLGAGRKGAEESSEEEDEEEEEGDDVEEDSDDSGEDGDTSKQAESGDSDEEISEEEDSDEEEVQQPPKKIKGKEETKKVDKGKSSLSNGTPSSNTTPGKKKKRDSLKTPNMSGITAASTPKDTPQKKVVSGGVMVEDVRIGTGPVAKPGRMVNVYYTGRLKQNNKQFDATTQGPGFKFRLGKSEVIKGWDVGVPGMKVGGKRRLIIPPNMGYGKQGQPPVIPPNSTLVFEVELKTVS